MVFGSQTVGENQVETVNGVTVSIAPEGSNLVVGDSTVPVTRIEDSGSSPVLSFGNSQMTAGSNGGFVVAPSSTLIAGGPALTIGGTTLSLASSSNVAIVNGVTQTIGGEVPTGPPSPVLQAGMKHITADVADGITRYVLAPGKTLTPGGLLTISGATYTLDQVGGIAIVNGVTQTILEAQPTVAPVLTIGGQLVTAQVTEDTTQFVLGTGKTLTAGGVAFVSGTTYSLPIAGSVINGATSTFARPTIITPPPELTIDGQGYPITTISGTAQIVIGSGTTLVAGSAVTISRNTDSLSASQWPPIVLINGVTSVLGFATTAPMLIIAGSTITPDVVDGATGYVLGPGATLTPGSGVVYSGTTYSLPTSVSILVVNARSSTVAAAGTDTIPPSIVISGHTYLPHVSGTSTWYMVDGTTLLPSQSGTITAVPVLTIADHTHPPSIAGTSTWYMVDGTTLTPEVVATIHGTTLSLNSSASVLVVDGKTSTVHTTAASRTGMPAVPSQTSAIGGYTTATSTTSSKGGSQASSPISVAPWIESWFLAAAGSLYSLASMST